MSVPTRAHVLGAGLAGVCLAAAIACGSQKDAAPGPTPPAQAAPAPGGAQSQAAAQVSEGARQVAEGARQVARGVQDLARAAATPVATTALEALLPDVPGWRKDPPVSETISTPMPYALTRARYTKDGAVVDLEIKDSALSQVLLGPVTMFMSSGYSETSEHGHKKAVSINGSPAFEDVDRAAGQAELTVIVAGRFVVTGRGRNVPDAGPVRTVVEAVSFPRLGRLK
jgi:hypothetical protein